MKKSSLFFLAKKEELQIAGKIICFILGTVTGNIIGIVTMCIFRVAKECNDEEEGGEKQ